MQCSFMKREGWPKKILKEFIPDNFIHMNALSFAQRKKTKEIRNFLKITSTLRKKLLFNVSEYIKIRGIRNAFYAMHNIMKKITYITLKFMAIFQHFRIVQITQVRGIIITVDAATLVDFKVDGL